jgi:hypothetical protein
MKFNIQSTLFASLVLLVGTAVAAPVGDEAGDLNVSRIQQRTLELTFRSKKDRSCDLTQTVWPRLPTPIPLTHQGTSVRLIVGHSISPFVYTDISATSA